MHRHTPPRTSIPESAPTSAQPWLSRVTRSLGRIGVAGRLALLAGLAVVFVAQFETLTTAAASDSTSLQQYPTPTPTPYGYRGYPTATPTPYGYRGYPTPTPYGNRDPWNPTPTPYGNQGYPTPTPYGSNPYPGSGNGSSVNGGTNPYPGSGGTIPGGIVPNPSMQPPGSQPGGQASPGALTDPCYGDEQISYSPEQPRVGNELLIAVTSSRPHPYGRLAGTEPAQFSRERPGQRGYVWEWIIQPSYPGQHEYTFYVDSTIPCQKIQIQVRSQLATATPTPTKTPKPYRYN